MTSLFAKLISYLMPFFFLNRISFYIFLINLFLHIFLYFFALSLDLFTSIFLFLFNFSFSSNHFPSCWLVFLQIIFFYLFCKQASFFQLLHPWNTRPPVFIHFFFYWDAFFFLNIFLFKDLFSFLPWIFLFSFPYRSFCFHYFHRFLAIVICCQILTNSKVTAAVDRYSITCWVRRVESPQFSFEKLCHSIKVYFSNCCFQFLLVIVVVFGIYSR